MKFKYIAILLGLSLLAGCASANATTTEQTATEQQSEFVETTEVETDLIDTEPTESAETTEVATETVEKDVISDNIFDFEFLYNGKKIKLPISYKEFSEITGWNADYVMANETEEYCTIEKGNHLLFSGIVFENPKYPDFATDFMCVASFGNFTNERVHLSDSSICEASFSIMRETELVDSWDEIKLPKGIEWGSTDEEIYAAYGDKTNKEWSDSFKTIVYEYWEKETQAYLGVDLRVHQEYGLTGISYHYKDYSEYTDAEFEGLVRSWDVFKEENDDEYSEYIDWDDDGIPDILRDQSLIDF